MSVSGCVFERNDKSTNNIYMNQMVFKWAEKEVYLYVVSDYQIAA